MDDKDEQYVSSEDEDFNPEATAADEDVSSSEGEETGLTKRTSTSRTKKRRHDGTDEELASGDEATIREIRKKKRRRKQGEEDDSEGEGGLVKTRAQRAAEKHERQEFRRANREGVTVDVDAIWSQLSSAPVGPTRWTSAQAIEAGRRDDSVVKSDGSVIADGRATDGAHPAEESGELVTIKRSYDFAGQTVSEEKVVHRDSAEAKLFFSNQHTTMNHKVASPAVHEGPQVRRPLKRASLFEPNATGEVKGLPTHKQRLRTPSRADVLVMQTRLAQEMQEKSAKAQKLNTVQKSAIDWATHVDEQGLKDELDEYGRSKQGYMGKMDFLRDVEGRRDLEERRARLQAL